MRAPFRRRGVAGVLTLALLHAARAAGVEVAFLMAAHEAEARIYLRAGFTLIGEILHISRPQAWLTDETQNVSAPVMGRTQ